MLTLDDRKHRQRLPKTWRNVLGWICVLTGVCYLLMYRQSAPYDYDGKAMLSLGLSLAGMDKADDPDADPLAIYKSSKLQRSLHPKWKLWNEMDTGARQLALDEVGKYLRKYGTLSRKNGKRGIAKQGSCKLENFGVGEGHPLCGPKPEGPCTFISFGINDDPSFDKDLATKWGCRGFAGDPTVHHPSKLHPLVTFHNIGATTLSANEERLINKGGQEDWWETSMPRLKAFLGMDHVNIIKLDCEGCEHAFARDIIREDPFFLDKVDQLSIETHVSRTWLNSTEALYYFGLHYALMEEAGFQLERSNLGGCSKQHEITGCMPELSKYGFPCGYDPWKGKPNVVLGYSCQDYLWKRYSKS